MSGRIPLSQIPRINKALLGPDGRRALTLAKNAIRSGMHREARRDRLPEEFRHLNLHPFSNEKDTGHTNPEPLPDPQRGCEYIACDIGRDRSGRRGSRRFVFESHCVRNDWGAIYYSDDHYDKFSFYLVEGR
jgi:hypothetical protein